MVQLMKYIRWFVALILVVSSSIAFADEASDAKAKEHYRAATAHFEAGRLKEALAGFEAGYNLSHKPGFLWNMAECDRLLHHNVRAKELYKLYLAEAGPYAPQRALAEQRLKELEGQPSSPVPPPPPIPTGLTTAPTANTSTPTDASFVFQPAPQPQKEQPTPITKTWWFWTGAGVLVAGAVTAIVVSTGGSSAPPPSSSQFTVRWN